MTDAKYLAVRSVHTVFLLLAILTILFFMFKMMPGGFSAVLMAEGASPEAIAAFEQKWGLNEPLHIQYFNYVTNFLSGDIGNSFQTGQPVFEMVKMRIFNSVILAAPAITVGFIIGSVVGSILGFKRGTDLEYYGLVGSIFAGSFPSFFTAMVAIIVFSGWLGLFPSGGLASLQTVTTTETWYGVYLTDDFLNHYILPFSVVTFRIFFLPAITMRTSVVEVSGQDFMYYHKLSGFSQASQIRRLIRHACLPVITLYPVALTRAISGLVLVEAVFNWPGIGFTLVRAVFNRDFPVLVFVFFLVAAFVVIANFIIDIVYTLVDPRISLGD